MTILHLESGVKKLPADLPDDLTELYAPDLSSIPATISNFKDLEVLHAPTTSRVAKSIKKLTKLRDLKVGFNEGKFDLGSFLQLERLHLRGIETLANLGAPTSLRSLDLTFDFRVKGDALAAISKLVSLESLSLDNFECDINMTGLTNLQTLKLRSSSITTMPVGLEDLKQLSSIVFDQCYNLENEELTKLMQALPQVAIDAERTGWKHERSAGKRGTHIKRLAKGSHGEKTYERVMEILADDEGTTHYENIMLLLGALKHAPNEPSRTTILEQLRGLLHSEPIVHRTPFSVLIEQTREMINESS